jgi:MipA family protein
MNPTFRRKTAIIVALLMLIFMHSLLASAQTDKPDSPPAKEETSSEEDTKAQSPGASSQKEFSFAIGGGLIVSPRPYVGAKSRIFPIPSIELEYKRWFFQGIRGGYGIVRSGGFSANLYAQARFSGLEVDSNPFLQGMEERKKSMDAGFEVVYRGRPLGFRVNYLADVLGKSNGQEATVLATSGVPLGRLGIILVGIGPRWLSQNHVDYYYGVRENEVALSRPAYSGKATWNLDINLTSIINLSSKWRLVAILNREGFGSGIEDSPIVDKNSAYTLVTSLSYKF